MLGPAPDVVRGRKGKNRATGTRKRSQRQAALGSPDNADALAKAQPRSRKTIIEGMTHTLKKASGPTRTEQIAAYTDDTLPVAPELVAAVTGFIKGL